MTVTHGNLTRRKVLQRSAAIGAGVAAASVLGHGPATLAAARQSAEDGVRGGTLRVGIIGEPPTLDQHQTTVTVVMDVTYPMYETLFTYDVDYQPVPELVDRHTMSEDGLTHTMTLRDGVMFHNGETMTAADVHASVMRWAGISGVGKQLFSVVDEFVEVDDRTVEFRLSEPYGSLVIALAHNSQACVIHPKSVIDAAGSNPFPDDSYVIGTGPYMLAERQADAYIRLARFEDYAGRDEPTSGYAGTKHAWVDEIEFLPVPDQAARVAGLQAGDYEVALEISNDQFELLSSAPGVVAEIRQPSFVDVFYLNWRSPIMGNLAMREAFRAALNHEEILTASRGNSDFYRLDPGWVMQELPWYTTAGGELYNVNDPELAKQKLEEAGYDGTPIRFLSTEEYPYFYAASVIAQQQLEAVGFVVDLQVTDWATVVERRTQEDAWEVFVTYQGKAVDPGLLDVVGQMGVYPGWWESDESLAIGAELLSESDFDTRFALWEQLQGNIYTEIPAVKLGDAAVASYYSDRVGGWVQQIERGIPYWNLWLEDA